MALPPIAPVQLLNSPIAAVTPAGSAAPASGAGGDFGKMISGLLDNLGQTEKTTTDLITRAAAGDPSVDVHDVMIATQAESLAFNVGVQVRNKLVEAWQEVFRMQV